MNQLNADYFICVFHKKCLLPDEVDEHKKINTSETGICDCEFIPEKFHNKTQTKIKKPWMARTIVENEGAIIYRYKKPQIVPHHNTIPPNAVLIDVDLSSKRF